MNNRIVILVTIVLTFHNVCALKSQKKGVSLTNGYGDAQMQALQVSWYYNWAPNPSVQTTVAFVPMIWSGKDIDKSVPSDSKFILGFNEPDLEAQSNMTVAEAVDLWPKVADRGIPTVAPATAHLPTIPESWLQQFMQIDIHDVDFVGLHWYLGANSTEFVNDVTSLYNLFKKQVWVTEFACQYIREAAKEPYKYSQAEVTQFISETVTWMENSPMVAFYAWHDSKLGTSSLYAPDGSGILSETGKVYAQTVGNGNMS